MAGDFDPSTTGSRSARPTPPPSEATSIRSEHDLLAGLPPARTVHPAAVAERVRRSGRFLVVLDDDPTGTQTVADVPILTAWSPADLRWAIRQGSPTFYILTNTRSMAPEQAAACNREIVAALAAAAGGELRRFTLLSRGDSTLRGHFPLEPDVLNDALAEHGEPPADGVLLCPAYLDAGRLTVADVHWMRTKDGMLPVGASEFARDATFGFRSTNLRSFVEEKTGGRWHAADVLSIGIEDIRLGGEQRVAELLTTLRNGRPAVVNAVCDDDLRVVAMAAMTVERSGRTLLYRTGPSFVRARAGQAARPPLSGTELYRGSAAAPHGLVIVGSHVSATTRQLAALQRRGGVIDIELDVAELLEPDRREAHVAAVAAAAEAGLSSADVVVSTTRRAMTGTGAAASLAIARRVSAGVTEVVRRVVAARTPRFVLAKGGITSSDVATGALGFRRAWVRGTALPGIVSIWSAVDGAAAGIPYVVFAGNVGDDESLSQVIDVLRGAS